MSVIKRWGCEKVFGKRMSTVEKKKTQSAPPFIPYMPSLGYPLKQEIRFVWFQGALARPPRILIVVYVVDMTRPDVPV